MPDYSVEVNVITANADHMAKAAEVLARAASGLVLEGIQVEFTLGLAEDVKEEGDA